MIDMNNTGKLDRLPLAELPLDVTGRRSALERTVQHVTNLAERWFPDAYVIALLALLVICVAALTIGTSPRIIITEIGDGYWQLNNFTYQMAMIIVTGFAVASCAPVRRAIKALAAIPKTGPGAIAFIGTLSIVTGLLHWGFGQMFSVFLVMACAAREDLRMDIRAAAAIGFVGNVPSLLGLSSAAALLHATPASMPPALLKISGVIPLTETIFLWQNGVMILVIAAVIIIVGYVTAPRGDAVRTAADMGIDTSRIFAALSASSGEVDRRPGDYLSDTPILTIVVGGLMLAWIVAKTMQVGFGATISNLNNYLFITLTIAFLFHWRVRNFIKAIGDSVPAVAGVLIQFPVYAAVAAVLMLAHNAEGQTVSTYLGRFFADVISKDLLPPVVGVYSIIVGMFIPSAGAKWIVEAPYILQAGNKVHSHLGWLINTYSGMEMLANLLNPFWMLPMIGLLRLRVRYVVGFTFIYFIFLAPVMIVAFWLLGCTMTYHPPVMP